MVSQMSRNAKSLFTGPRELAVVKLEHIATFYISKGIKKVMNVQRRSSKAAFPLFLVSSDFYLTKLKESNQLRLRQSL